MLELDVNWATPGPHWTTNINSNSSNDCKHHSHNNLIKNHQMKSSSLNKISKYPHNIPICIGRNCQTKNDQLRTVHMYKPVVDTFIVNCDPCCVLCSHQNSSPLWLILVCVFFFIQFFSFSVKIKKKIVLTEYYISTSVYLSFSREPKQTIQQCHALKYVSLCGTKPYIYIYNHKRKR